MRHLDHCEICKSSRLKFVFAPRDMFEPSQSYPIDECQACHVRQTRIQPEPEEIASIYPDSYYGEESQRFHPWIEKLLRQIFRQRSRKIFGYYPLPGAVIDVGCGRGSFLELFAQRGWRVCGIELSAAAACAARHTLGEKQVLVGDFLSVELPEESFDVVVFWHVFEHLTHPKQCLEKVQRLLKPGGMIVIAVPNSGSFQAKIGGQKWFHLDVPRHIFHYSDSTLSSLMQNHGFEVVHSSFHSLEYNPFGLLQSIFSWVFPENNMYNFLRNSSGKLEKSLDSNRTTRFKDKIRFVASWIEFSLFLLLFPLALCGSIILEFFRLGGCVAIYGKKAETSSNRGHASL